MKFAAAALALLIAIVEARPEFTNSNFAVEAGVPFTLKWSNAVGEVTITLKNGDPDNLKTVEVIDSGDTGTSFTWTPPSTLPSDTYAFEISDESGDQPNYSTQFTFAGSASATGSLTSASATAATTSSASASASETSTASSTESSSAATTSSSSASTTTSESSSSSSTSASSTSFTTSTSSTASTTSSSATSSTTSVSNTNDGKRLGSPLALVFVAVASLLYFN
ncbi:hypothetical protein NKR23_g41 [Pleurostoma richardsiae]|uniref:Extracellular matrix protein n=1 Tax=Pleurostoma richardsiae TaxID=41990 RepID=A0AA38S722_9PEZI|nr:hypothetical protein NKR23_g41 [Pleurostoma richardsiae]